MYANNRCIVDMTCAHAARVRVSWDPSGKFLMNRSESFTSRGTVAEHGSVASHPAPLEVLRRSDRST